MVPMRRSKALQEIGYDDEPSVLRVRFRDGGLYDYFVVPRAVFDDLLVNEHPWTTWREEILTHPFARAE